jgi:hypothetical protein
MPFKNPHPLYSVWQGMLRRCDNPRYPQFKDYGGRGIRVCDRWLRDFGAFVSDMGDRPAGYFIDRIDNDGNYEPSNCRWVTRAQSQSNRRITQRLTIEGVTYLLADLARRSGLKPDTIKERHARGVATLAELLAPEKRHNLAGFALGGPANGARKRAQTHCLRGHAFTDRNTHITKQGWRQCRKCRADRAAGRV